MIAIKFKYILIILVCLFCLKKVDAQTVGNRTYKVEKKASSQGIIKDVVPKSLGWISDYEKLFTKEQVSTLTQIINDFNKKSEIQIALLTVDSTMTTAQNFDNFTLKVANTWGVGQKEKDNGILIGFSCGFRKIRINNGYGIEKLISDAETKKIIDNYFIPGFKSGDYYAGAKSGLTELIKLLNTKN